MAIASLAERDCVVPTASTARARSQRLDEAASAAARSCSSSVARRSTALSSVSDPPLLLQRRQGELVLREVFQLIVGDSEPTEISDRVLHETIASA